jgi:hypothetical protein
LRDARVDIPAHDFDMDRMHGALEEFGDTGFAVQAEIVGFFKILCYIPHGRLSVPKKIYTQNRNAKYGMMKKAKIINS